MSFILADKADGEPDRVHLADEAEIRRLCRELGCTEIELRSALTPDSPLARPAMVSAS